MGNYDFYASSADVQRATDAVNRLNTTVMMNGFIDSMYNEEKLQGIRGLDASVQNVAETVRQCVQKADEANASLNDIEQAVQSINRHSEQTNEQLSYMSDQLDEIKQAIDGAREESRKSNDRTAWYQFDSWKATPDGQWYCHWREAAMATISKIKKYTCTMQKARMSDCLTLTKQTLAGVSFPQPPATIDYRQVFIEPKPQPPAKPEPPTLRAVPPAKARPQRHSTKPTLFLIGGVIVGVLISVLALIGFMANAFNVANTLAQIPYEDLPQMANRTRSYAFGIAGETIALGAVVGLGLGALAHRLYTRKEMPDWNKKLQEWNTYEQSRQQIIRQNSDAKQAYQGAVAAWQDNQNKRVALWRSRQQEVRLQCEQQNQQAQASFEDNVRQIARQCFDSANQRIPLETSWCSNVDPIQLLNTLTDIIVNEIDDPVKRAEFKNVSPYMPQLTEITYYDNENTPTMKDVMIWITWQEQGQPALSDETAE